MDFLQLVQALVTAYVEEAWPFALLHLLVIGVILYKLVGVRRETRALNQYHRTRNSAEAVSAPAPKQLKEREVGEESAEAVVEQETVAASSDMLDVLYQFEKEAKLLGRQGLIVPMTDFSDRLDAVAEQRIGSLSDYTSLLLIIGIAGTMFGVFEFAYSASDVLAGTSVADSVTVLSQRLSQSMAKAFPVGVIGLFLMFIFQSVTGHYEHRLQEAISHATQAALIKRAGVVISPTEVIQEAAVAIRRGLEPLADLRLTLSESVRPVVEALAQRLDEALRIVRTQFEELRTTTAGMNQAAGDIRDLVSDMRLETASLKQLLERAPEVLERIVTLQAEQERMLESAAARTAAMLEESARHVLELQRRTQQEVEQAIARLKTSADIIAALPEDVHALHRAAAKEVERVARDAWDTHAEAFAENLHAEYSTLLSAIESQVEALPKRLGEAAEALHHLASSLRVTLTEEFKKAVEEALRIAEGHVNTILLDRYPDALDQVAAMTTSLQELTGNVQAIQKSYDDTLERVHVLNREFVQLFATFQARITQQGPSSTEEFDKRLYAGVQEIHETLREVTDNIHAVEPQLREALDALIKRPMDGNKGNADPELLSVLHDLKEALHELKTTRPTISIGPLFKRKR